MIYIYEYICTNLQVSCSKFHALPTPRSKCHAPASVMHDTCWVWDANEYRCGKQMKRHSGDFGVRSK